jgi:hypothetical protein
MKEELTAFSDLTSYMNSLGGIQHVIKEMSSMYINSQGNYTMGTKSTRRKVEVKRPLVERLEKLCGMIVEHIKSVKQLNMHIDAYMPDPYFDYKDVEGITNRITLTTLRSYLLNAKDEAKFNANYKLTPELAVIFNQYFKSVKPQ